MATSTFNTDNPVYGMRECAPPICTDHHELVYAMPNKKENPYSTSTTKSQANGNIHETKQDGQFECAHPKHVDEQRKVILKK